MRQLSLFGGRPLLLPDLRRRFVQDRTDTILPEREAVGPLQDFDAYIASAVGRRATELSLEQRFSEVFFCRLLGYDMLPGTGGRWTFWPKPSQSVTRLPGDPDAALGHFTQWRYI
jgi:hypothetical protein